jgi:Secretion system C-terminal sorting domain
LHTVTVTDMNGCTATGTAMMTEPTAVGGTATMTQQATCSDANGAAAVNAHGGIPPHTYAWSNSNSVIFNPNNLTAGTNTVTITDTNGCTGFAFVTITADLTGCVFPGDANNDGIANNADLLPIALSNALTGSSRANASTQWLPQTAQDWATTVPNTTTNTKHADCDGDGVVTANDTLTILQNYGQTHQRDPRNEVWHNNSPTISCLFPNDTTGSTVYPYTLRSNIMVGDAAIPAIDITGLAFTINYDATVASSAYMLLENMSWLGAPNELYHLYHDDGQGHIDIAISRFDGTTRNGMGAVASCNFVITDNVIGRGVNNANYNFNVSVSGIKAINNQNIPKAINGADSHTTMQGMVLGTTQNDLENAVRIFPNPLNGNILTIKTDNLKCTNAVLHNVLGQAVFSTTLNNAATHNLTLTDLTNGVYTLTLTTDKGNVVRKVIVAR